eukprot:8628634-Pyramimonas_sp.AAC.1
MLAAPPADYIRKEIARKTTVPEVPIPAAPPEQQEPQEAGRAIAKMSGRRLDAIQPSIDLKDLPGKLMKASPAEQDRLLRG